MSRDYHSLSMLNRRLLRGEITYSAAKERDSNILHELGYRDQKIRYFTHLYRNRKLIKASVVHHLGLASTDTCQLVDVEHWIHGSFNVCIRVDVDCQGRGPGKQLIIRFPLPYRIGENCCPGNADEKVRCEVGTYAWLQDNCPAVPIPQLYGFGLSTGQTFTFLDNLPFIPRIIQRVRRRLLSWLNYPTPTLYVQHQSRDQIMLGTPYLLIEYIDPSRGQMLSETWEEGRHNIELRTNLFHGLSRIILNLACIPLPKIGSFVLDEKGYLSLSNRPLTLEILQLENEHIPVDMPQNTTHSTVDAYINDILAFHESRLRHQPNAVNNVEDGFYQTSALMVMKSVWSCFFRRDLHRGPFFLSLTDLNQSNIFVDDNWNIKCLVDLEWVCSHPVEMIHPPYWLTNQAIDLINRDDYEILHKEFMEAFSKEEMKIKPPVCLCPILQQGWERGTFWYSLALSSPTALFKIFYDFIQPMFSKVHDDPAFWQITMPYWTFNTYGFIQHKLKDKEQYDALLREAFESGTSQG
ncbi:hypothetical protein P175DRAFT_0433956 [Aspergillus ochraceoroseus IBT 24754]|uniref:Aminoglycoside phosphotransferase domain-containing protein n=2 Tax=Aspergillus ochraceoroseus TaxID=138278 RepID=A0A2T5M316_9EURO|nr:uncharacterized protein P175DRAFT_0433956 [Aspergillus ochraceoroseus IBT 24754]KKK20159.1 hypothetical protein AOCH_006456 [Aspergillus ochraceoroseus]PTU22924.1 hypothetical protein P175DRAFT_0433956 [Aspergillus ochraceoroseus IBT 24754]